VAFAEVSDALVARQKLEVVYLERTDTVKALQTSVALSLQRYNDGISSYFEVLEAEQQLFPEIGVGYLATAKLDDRFDAIAFLEESHGVIFLEFVVMVVGIGAKFKLLDLDHVLFLLGLVQLFLLLVLIVAIVDGLGDWRNRRRSDQNQIETHVLRLPQSSGGGHDLCFPVGEHRANFARPNGLIYIFSAILLAGRKLSAWSHLLAAKGPFIIAYYQITRKGRSQKRL